MLYLKNWDLNYDTKLFSLTEAGNTFEHDTRFIYISSFGEIYQSDCVTGEFTEIEIDVFETDDNFETSSLLLKCELIEIYDEMGYLEEYCV